MVNIPRLWKMLPVALVILIGLIIGIVNIYLAYGASGSFGFPLDDAWIHLQFARNLHDYGAFSYYKDEMITSGSTSPLFTFLLSIGFFFTSNEYIISYSIGLSVLVIAGFIFFKLVLLLFDNNYLLSFFASLLFTIESRLQWIAISGMETTLFIALILAVIFFYYSKKAIPLGISSGLLLWTRPEAVILIAIIVLDLLYNRFIVRYVATKKGHKNRTLSNYDWIKISTVILLVFSVAYIIFNYSLSGTIFPNTYAAKLKFYSAKNPNYPKEVFHFLTDNHFILPAVFALLGALIVLWQIKERDQCKMLIPLLWVLLLFIAYWKNLPKLFQNGRYLMPVIPCFLLLNIYGINKTLEFIKTRTKFLLQYRNQTILLIIIFSVILFQFVNTAIFDENMQKDYFGYINKRQVKTALWMKENLPQDAIVATHDIGAIAFYSNRRIVDMVGLVSPEMIKNLMLTDSLIAFMVRNKVTHFATLQSWFPITNSNPMFQTDPKHPEVMEVYKFIPERFHISSQRALKLNGLAELYLEMGNAMYALEMLKQSLSIDPLSAPANFLMAKAARQLGNTQLFKERLLIAYQLQPDLPGLEEELKNLKK